MNLNCLYCDEPLERNDRTNYFEIAHYECLIRIVAGSVAHQSHTCGCFVPGSNAGDPPGMSLRQGAVAAAEHFRKLKLKME